MTASRLITLLICFNLALLGAAAFLFSKRQPAFESRGYATSIISTNAARQVVLNRAKPMSGKAVSEKFTWDRLQSKDYKAYIANLREAHCPEETIQDIIIAAVNQEYNAREAALKLRPQHLKPWDGPESTSSRNWDKLVQLRELLQEKHAFLKELLGIDVPVEMPLIRSRDGHAKLEAALSLLPEDKRDAVRAIQEKFWIDTGRLQQRTTRRFDSDDRTEYLRMRAERGDALAKVLTSTEIDELELRISSTATSLRSQLTVFEPTEKEFRDIFKLKREFYENYNTRGGVDPEDRDFTQQRDLANQQVEQQIKTLLGPERYGDYQRSQDGNFRRLAQIAQETGLPRETAVTGYEIQKASREEIQILQANANLPRDERRQAILDVRKQTDDALRQTLGEEAFKRFKGPARVVKTPPAAQIVPTP